MTPDLSLTSFRLAIPDHAIGLPVLRALSLCACCRQYPGTATDGTSLLIHPVVSAFPRRAAGSACASSFSRLSQRSLTLRPAHSRCHRILWPAIRRLQPFRYLHSCSGCFRLEHFAGWGLHPLEKRRLCTAHAQRRRPPCQVFNGRYQSRTANQTLRLSPCRAAIALQEAAQPLGYAS